MTTKRRKYVIGKKYFLLSKFSNELSVYTCVTESNKYGYFVTDNGIPYTCPKCFFIMKPYTKAVELLYAEK